jgi:starch synthase
MNILLASSEVHPYSKTGGLGDAVAALGGALAQAGHQVAVVTPLYRGIQEKSPAIERVDWKFDFAIGHKRVHGKLSVHKLSDRLTVYFVDCPQYFDRTGIYNDNNHDYTDNAERFIFLSKCVVNLALHLPMKPGVLHLNDWPVAPSALLLRHEAAVQKITKLPKVCFTIHNLAYQGVFPASTFQLLNLPGSQFNADTMEFYGQMNCLKAGLACSDAITTVSPRYAREITTQEYGCGLDGLLRRRQNILTGILNGVDYDEWNTQRNPFLNAPYSADNLSGKRSCKLALQERFKLTQDIETPLFGCVTRLADQKGIDLLVGSLEETLNSPMQFVLLGSGSKHYEHALNKIAAKFPGKVGLHLGYDHVLAHKIEAGSDFYLMPSRFEPCGLNQLYSLRYGTIPIVRRTGGLDDSVVDAIDNPAKPNGIKFNDPTAMSLAKAIQKALALFGENEHFNNYRINGMNADFSWANSVKAYERVYLA